MLCTFRQFLPDYFPITVKIVLSNRGYQCAILRRKEVKCKVTKRIFFKVTASAGKMCWHGLIPVPARRKCLTGFPLS
jgi:hypothetical protein